MRRSIDARSGSSIRTSRMAIRTTSTTSAISSQRAGRAARDRIAPREGNLPALTSPPCFCGAMEARRAERRFEAPRAGTASGDVEEDERVEERELTAVVDRCAALRRMGDEVRGDHLDARQQTGPARDQAQRDQNSAD